MGTLFFILLKRGAESRDFLKIRLKTTKKQFIKEISGKCDPISHTESLAWL